MCRQETKMVREREREGERDRNEKGGEKLVALQADRGRSQCGWAVYCNELSLGNGRAEEIEPIDRSAAIGRQITLWVARDQCKGDIHRQKERLLESRHRR